VGSSNRCHRSCSFQTLGKMQVISVPGSPFRVILDLVLYRHLHLARDYLVLLCGERAIWRPRGLAASAVAGAAAATFALRSGGAARGRDCCVQGRRRAWSVASWATGPHVAIFCGRACARDEWLPLSPGLSSVTVSHNACEASSHGRDLRAASSS